MSSNCFLTDTHYTALGIDFGRVSNKAKGSNMRMLVMLVMYCLMSMSRLEAVDEPSKKIWSILICTLDERKESFDYIYSKLQQQIMDNNLTDVVEVLFFRDNREHSIGFKRNALLQQSSGEYVCFVDDDDDVHDAYVPMIYEKLLEKPDCVKMIGIMTTDGQNPQMFVHSIEHGLTYAQWDGVYIRPPNHLNPIKRSIALQFLFAESNHGEDFMWALSVARSGILRQEANIEVPCYFYQYDGKYTEQSKPVEKVFKPRVSIITSVYKGDEFIAGFLADIVQQTIFDECELLIINANSPGNEEPIILEYCSMYPNIVYERLEVDPGLYGVWNYAIKKARAPYITNANVDDRRNPESLEMHARALDEDATIDLVYSDFYGTYVANETFECNSSYGVISYDEFAPERMNKCLPGPQPMWRKSVHVTCGYFDESFFSSGDLEFWNRLARCGIRFKKVPGISGLFYQNPRGISTDQDTEKVQRRDAENARIVQEYRAMWGW